MQKLSFFLALMTIQLPFKQAQLRNERVRNAYAEKEGIVMGYFKEKKVGYEQFRLFIRAFKQERIVEVWAGDTADGPYVLLHRYDFCATSGTPGPKRREGDLQIPEGVYSINHFNPQSNFHLSLGINYPNASDRILSDKVSPGSDIYLHGNCVTIGCIPLTDDKIKELYVLAVEAQSGGQQSIPVHIFPAKLTNTTFNTLKNEFPANAAFWQNLKTVYDDFENSRTLKPIHVTRNGEYRF